MLETISPYLCAANVDLKGFDDRRYRRIMGAKLSPVLESIKTMKALGIFVEVTTLIVPGLNDSTQEIGQIAEFLAGVDKDIPWHISRFHPDYKMTHVPPTPKETLFKAFKIGKEAGLRFVYVGNLPGNSLESTYCPKCSTCLIERLGFRVTTVNIKDGACPRCHEKIPGIFTPLHH
jgi:pyruvate formate lyase activating enzyme